MRLEQFVRELQQVLAEEGDIPVLSFDGSRGIGDFYPAATWFVDTVSNSDSGELPKEGGYTRCLLMGTEDAG